MPRFFCSILLVAGAGLVSPMPATPDEPDREIRGWGAVVDPDRDCRIDHDKGRLLIVVPAGNHDLAAEVDRINAPRVLAHLDGDFIAQVRVAGNIRHGGNRKSDHFLAYHGAGLLLWQDARTYIRLERASVVQDGGPIDYANFELRRDGKSAKSLSFEIPDKPTYLRMERRGGRVVAAVSDDGIHWISFDPIAVGLPEKVRLGVAAINTASEPLKAEFSDLEVFRKEKR